MDTRERLIVRSLGKGLLAFLLAMGLGFSGPCCPCAKAQSPDTSELKSQELQPTFRLRTERNLVVVRVVVRDSKGNVVGKLGKDDFRILDNGKPQIITQFSLEEPTARRHASTMREAATRNEESQPESKLGSSIAQRYVALYYDDVHMPFQEVAQTREALNRLLAAALQPGDRVGLFTSSGQTVLDFTDDLEKLHEAISHLRPTPLYASESSECPNLSEQQAYVIVHEHDPIAIDAASRETLACRYNDDQKYLQEAQSEAEGAAYHTLNRGETRTEYALRGIEQLVRRMASLPGERIVVLISPGFFSETMRQRVGEITDRALRSNVLVNAVDSRGLYTIIPGGDISNPVPIGAVQHADVLGKKEMYRIDQLSMDTEAVQRMALDTGGTFFHNSNDLARGLRQALAFPEAYYVLGFSPQKLKLDGSYHTLKVQLVSAAGLSVQARRGYYAPLKPIDDAEQAKEEIEEALYSQDELQGLPVDVHTQFFRVNGTEARISILTHLDMQPLRFRKAGDRNLDKLTFATVVFDRDGKYVAGKEKLLDLRLRDTSLEQLLHSGLTLKTNFDVPPGTYLVREVVREAEGGLLSGLSRSIEIPY